MSNSNNSRYDDLVGALNYAACITVPQILSSSTRTEIDERCALAWVGTTAIAMSRTLATTQKPELIHVQGESITCATSEHNLGELQSAYQTATGLRWPQYEVETFQEEELGLQPSRGTVTERSLHIADKNIHKINLARQVILNTFRILSHSKHSELIKGRHLTF